MSDVLPYTFEEALKKLGSNFDHLKLLDHIANGDIKACFRYDGVIGYLNSFIHFLHSQLSSDDLATEIIDSFDFHGWLTIDVGSEEINHLLYTPNASYDVCSSSEKFPHTQEHENFNFILLDVDQEWFLLDETVTTPRLISKTIYLKDLRITPESLNSFIKKYSEGANEYTKLLKEFEELQKKYDELKNDLISAKSKKSYNQVVYMLCNFPYIIDLESKPYESYNHITRYFDEQKKSIPIPTDETIVKIFRLAKEEFNNYSPK